MSNAKLIKREEWLEQKRVAQQQARLSAAARVKVETARDWVKCYQAAPKPNTRALFAALFA